ncbi:thiamine diphosphokinase [Paenisporosarcina sp. NPDC076898]|uniref:thiamine diphosphokinase n=1 Tax=unclassified Paenisporosarcina TaxID=2642018 RepID=UPI003CFF8CF1
MKTAVICAGGPLDELAEFEPFRGSENVIFIGADKGAIYLLNERIQPNVAVGDFDSLTPDELSQLKEHVESVKVAPAEKNETDTDLAIAEALHFNPDHILVTGVTGGRLDHFMAVLNSVYRFQKNNPSIQFTIRNKWNEMKLLTPGITPLIKDRQFPFVSFFAFQGSVEHVTLTGMKYNVCDELIEMGNSRFTSNEVLDEHGSISFASGICLLIRSSDQ